MKRFFLLALLLVCVNAGCAPTMSPGYPPVAPSSPKWESVGEGVERLEVPIGTAPTKGTLLIYRVPTEGWTWSVEYSTSAQSVREWAETLPEAMIIANGGYFHEDLMPSGALWSHGEQVGTRKFDADKSAYVVLAPRPRIVDLSREPKALDGVRDLIQTYPYLVKEGKPAIEEDSGKLAERTFIGTDRREQVYLGVVIGATVSLYELMQLLQDQPINWMHVVNLDGGPSTGFVVRTEKENRSRNSLTPVPGVIVGRPH
jgi:exopolysaccharide biosynthesis protein